MTLPKLYTQEDQDKRDREDWKNGGERAQLLLFLRAFSNGGGSLPLTDNYAKVQTEATEDFRRSDYSAAQSYVDTLTELVEFYKELAENYLEALTDYAIAVDQYGSVSNYPFVLVDDGYEILGRAEVLNLDEHDSRSLWRDYIKPFLPFATERERVWIAEHFADYLNEEVSP